MLLKWTTVTKLQKSKDRDINNTPSYTQKERRMHRKNLPSLVIYNICIRIEKITCGKQMGIPPRIAFGGLKIAYNL